MATCFVVGHKHKGLGAPVEVSVPLRLSRAAYDAMVATFGPLYMTIRRRDRSVTYIPFFNHYARCK